MSYAWNSVKILVGVFIASVLLFIVTSPLLMIQTESAAIITCVIFQAFTTVVIGRLCGRVKPWLLFVTILTGSSIISLCIRIRYFTETLGSFRIFVGILVAIVVGYLVFRLLPNAGAQSQSKK